MNNTYNYLDVVCINTRENFRLPIVGERYIIDRLSIWIDKCGNSYGYVYDKYFNRIGEMKLSLFSCI